jgi:hypothetical protein
MTQSGQERPSRISWKGFTLVLGLSVVFLVALTIFIDNSNAITSNGLWKLGTVLAWRDAPGRASTEPANALYFPLMGAGVRLAEMIWPGGPWTHVAMINAAFFAMAGACCYQTILVLTGQRAAAAGAALCHTFLAFPLFLATSSEDIGPGYAFYTLALLGVAFTARGNRSVWWAALTGLAFTQSWLQHWTLLLPAFLPLLVAMFWCGREQGKAFWKLPLAFLCGAALVLVLIGAFTPVPVNTLLWPGKGLGSGWAGWTFDKVVYTFAAIAHYQFFGLNAPSFATLIQWPYICGLLIGLVTFGALVWFVARGKAQWRTSPPVYATLLAALGTFVCGEIMNLYSQPQDPQMQVQPLYWMVLAIGLFLSDTKFRRRAALVTSYLALLILLNGRQLLLARGGDSQALSAVRQLEKASPPTNTLWVEHAFDQVNSWTFVLWPAGDRHICHIGTDWVAHPKWTSSQVVANALKEMGQAKAQGRNLVAGAIWDKSEDEFVGSFQTIVGPDQSRPLYRALHETYDGVPLTRTHWGQYYLLVPRKKPSL